MKVERRPPASFYGSSSNLGRRGGSLGAPSGSLGGFNQLKPKSGAPSGSFRGSQSAKISRSGVVKNSEMALTRRTDGELKPALRPKSHRSGVVKKLGDGSYTENRRRANPL